MDSFKFDTEFSLLDTTLTDSENEAFAAISLNPAVTWAKFILTDDKPNANKQRIPLEEFDNIIKTGVFMPIKMAAGKINDGHEESFPIGVITHLRKNNSQITGLAALWERERPEDVGLIKERYAGNKQLQLSWEVYYKEASDEDGVTALKDTVLRGVTLVGMPAYEGRTPIIAVASETQKESNSAEMEELEILKTKVTELEAALLEKDTVIAGLKTKDEERETELTSLREFKAGIDKQREEDEKMASIISKFKEAKIEKDEEYFKEKRAELLGLSPEVLDFMIQEMVSFSSASKKEGQQDDNKEGIPNLSGGKLSLKENDIVGYLKSRLTK